MQGSNGLEKQNGNTSQTNDVSEDLRDLVIIYPLLHTVSKYLGYYLLHLRNSGFLHNEVTAM